MVGDVVIVVKFHRLDKQKMIGAGPIPGTNERKRKMKEFILTGIYDGWKVITEAIKARTLIEAKKKLRKRYKGILYIKEY